MNIIEQFFKNKFRLSIDSIDMKRSISLLTYVDVELRDNINADRKSKFDDTPQLWLSVIVCSSLQCLLRG